MKNVNSLSTWTASQFDPTLNWKDVEWVRKLWPGKLILKGILDPGRRQARRQNRGDAIIVSNHGGRQLDGTSSVDLDAAESGRCRSGRKSRSCSTAACAPARHPARGSRSARGAA
jgi:hypothetical protein